MKALAANSSNLCMKVVLSADSNLTQKSLPSHSHSAKSKELVTINCNRIKRIVKSGNANKLEKIIREGRGYHLIGEFSSDPKIRGLLKSVPFYMARIDMLHDAVTEGQLRDLQILLDTTSPMFSALKPKAENLVLCKDQAGVGLLHKAVYYDHPHIIEWLIYHYPATTQLRDKMGRIPLHYVSSTTNPERNWQLLVEHGSPVDSKDATGRTALFYLSGDEEIHLPRKVLTGESLDEGIASKPSNLRIWIHDQDTTRLREVIWQGFGDRLKTQTSNKATMKKFLSAVPYVMRVIRGIHKAAIENNVNMLATLCQHPVPAIILKSKDDKGITALHKACGLGNVEVVIYILKKYPQAIHIHDNEGRIPIHYAAIFAQELVYQKLSNAGANERIIDKNGKTAKDYRNEGDSGQDSELLRQLPVNPRTGLGMSVNDENFNWSLIGWGDRPIPAVTVDVDLPSYSILDTRVEGPSKTKVPDDDGCTLGNSQLALSAMAGNGEPNLDSIERRRATAPGSYLVHPMLDSGPDASEDVEDGMTRSLNLFEDVEFTVAEQVHSMANEGTNSSRREDEDRSDKLECDSDTTAPCVDDDDDGGGAAVELIGQQLARPAEQWPTDSMREISLRELGGEMELRIAVESALRTENLEEIGQLVLAGYGERLLRVTSENPAIQELVRHLPTFLTKINLIHRCCETGNVEEVRKYLDRRKLAVGRESSSELFATPLHVAVVFDRIEVMRYLGGRFPETLNQPDGLGRTPLHYAAMRAHGQFAYHTLLTLGANKDLQDHEGYSAQFYYDSPKEQYHEELSNIVQKLKFDKNGITDPMRSAETEDEAAECDASECANTRTKEVDQWVEAARASVVQSTTDLLQPQISLPESSNTSPPEENGSMLKYNPSSNVFLPLSRDKYGRTAIHLAASKARGRNFLLQMLHDLGASVAHRDELNRTARDVAALSHVYENVKAIDEYVVQIAANGENDKIINLLIDGYDHILETETDENILNLVALRDHQTTLAILETVLLFQEKREQLHAAVRRGDKIQMMELFRQCGKDAALMAVSKNELCRCSLHIAILTQRKDIVKYLAKKFPTTLHTGDNLERTPLHYAMALEKVEEFSTVLIRNGARRTAKDLKGRQPTYYFVNKEEIIRMQHEENYLFQEMKNCPRQKL